MEDQGRRGMEDLTGLRKAYRTSSLIGAAIIGVLRNGFILLGLPIAAQTIGIGLVVILSVTIDSIRTRRAA